MELKAYWTVIRRWLWMIVVVTMVATLTSAFVSKYVIKPTYQAATTILVNQKDSSQALLAGALYNDIMTNEALVQTYSQIMTSNTVLDAVIRRLRLPVTTAQLAKDVAVNSANQSEVITLSVNDRNIGEAVRIANTLAQEFQRKVVQLMQVQNVQIVDPATVPAHPIAVSPKAKTNTAIAFVLGLLVSVGLAFLIEYLDDSVRSDEDVAAIFGASVLGVIPMMSDEDKKTVDARGTSVGVTAHS